MEASGASLTLMLIALGGAHLRIELGPDLFEQLVEAGRVVGGHRAHGAMRIHGHGCD